MIADRRLGTLVAAMLAVCSCLLLASCRTRPEAQAALPREAAASSLAEQVDPKPDPEVEDGSDIFDASAAESESSPPVGASAAVDLPGVGPAGLVAPLFAVPGLEAYTKECDLSDDPYGACL